MDNACILIADDEKVISDQLEAVFAEEGCKTIVAADGIEALKVLERELPDLVILDITMPRLDGYEVLHRIRERWQIPVIMISALSEMEHKIKCLKLGASDYITKPFAVEEFAN